MGRPRKGKWSTARSFLAECDGCGAKWRCSSRATFEAGRPLCGVATCTARGEPMRDMRAFDLDEERGQGCAIVRRNEYRKIRRMRYCDDCGRTHHLGTVMHYQKGSAEGRALEGYFCMSRECDADVNEERDKPGIPPTGLVRLHALMGSKRGGDR